MSDSEYQAYLDGLKPGDKIEYAAITGGFDRVKCVASIVVTRRTATQIVCNDSRGHEIRYQANGGRMIGSSSWLRKLPIQSTPEEIAAAHAEYARHNGARRLTNHSWHKEPGEVIDAVLQLIEKNVTK